MANYTLQTMKIGFIGFGNMAQAMADGLLASGTIAPEQIAACARHWERLCANTQPKGFHPFKTAAETAEWADLIILAVKPHQIKEVTAPILDTLRRRTVVSIAVEWTYSAFEEILLPGTHHLSTMPNTPVSICEGITLFEEHHSLDAEEYSLMEELFSKLGLVESVQTRRLSIAGTITACGPAFASMFIEALADAGVLHGLPRSASYRLVSQMISGTGKLQLATGDHPGLMKDAVCSPGGTAIVGVTTLEHKGFRSAVIDAVDMIHKRRVRATSGNSDI